MDLCSGFLHPEKIHQPQLGLNLRTLDLEASTVPVNLGSRGKHGTPRPTSGLSLSGSIQPQKIFLLKKATASLMFLYPVVYGTFGSSKVDLHRAAGDSVYSARCFWVPLILCGIQILLNFSSGFAYSFYVMFLIILTMWSVTPRIYARTSYLYVRRCFFYLAKT